MCSTNNYARRSMSVLVAVLFALLVLSASSAFAQTTAFTYQGRLTDSQATSSTYDLQFTLNNGATLLTCNGAAATNNICEDVSVASGLFTVRLDFGAAFDGATRTLGIAVRRGTETDAFTPLSPNQPITSTPYAIQSLNATNAAQLGGVAASNYLQTTGSGTNLTNLNASNITSGTLSDTQLSTNVALRNTTNTFTGNQFFTGNLSQTGTTADLTLTNGFVARGTLNTGAIPAEGAGTRMMWYPGKSAFRAGYVDGTQWDEANIGNYSAAFGYNARSSGDYGFSAGERVAAANSWSLAIGHYNTASGASSVALGEGAHTNARQGSFVFADRSYSGNICDASTLSSPYGQNNSGCAATGGVDTILRAPNNNSFTVRASGGTTFYTNQTSTTGLRFSGLNSSSVLYGSFVWSDRSSDSSLSPTAQNQTVFRTSGGFTIYTNAAVSSGVTVSPGGGSWSSISDRNMKENVAPVNSRDVLRKVLNLPITTWNYKSQDASIRHIGAMAQDFKAAFNVGEDDKHIATIDPDGVAFAAIQGLNEELKERDKKIESQQIQLNALQTQVETLKKLVCVNNPTADICK